MNSKSPSYPRTSEPIFHSATYYSHDHSYTRGNRICPMVEMKKAQHMLGLEALHKQQHTIIKVK